MPPSRTPRNKAERHADETDGERGPGRQHQARPDVAAQLVGAEQEQRVLRLAVGRRPNRWMSVGDQAEEVDSR